MPRAQLIGWNASLELDDSLDQLSSDDVVNVWASTQEILSCNWQIGLKFAEYVPGDDPVGYIYWIL